MRLSDTLLIKIVTMMVDGNTYALEAWEKIVKPCLRRGGDATLDELSDLEELMEDAEAEAVSPSLTVDMRRERIFS